VSFLEGLICRNFLFLHDSQRHAAFDWNLGSSLPMVKKRQGNFGAYGQGLKMENALKVSLKQINGPWGHPKVGKIYVAALTWK